MNKSINRNTPQYKELVSFIKRYKYDLWVTITFRDPIIVYGKKEIRPITEIEAKKRLQSFLANINTPDQMFYKHRIKCLVFYEKNRYRKGIHIHALVRGVDVSLAPALKALCNDYFGESEVKAGHEDVPRYLADKVISNTLIEMEPLTIHSHSVRSKQN